LTKSDAEWRRELSPEEYQVAREGGTERAFTGALLEHQGDWNYRCVCCGEPLFDSSTKYDSGSGWPSFYAPIDETALAMREDRSHFMQRIEVLCAACDAISATSFRMVPEPSGLRYCMNSLSLKLEPRADRVIVPPLALAD